MTAIPLPLHEHEIATALEVARAMARVGVPIFVAPPCGIDKCHARCVAQNKGLGTDTGYHLPQGWERTVASEKSIDAWQPGWALCAVGGHVVDFVDVDVKDGGDRTAAALSAAGKWPYSYGRQATPSGGFHELVAPLRVGSANPIGKGTSQPCIGVDLRGGRPDGEGRGFIFIAPTVRRSKTDGVPRGYRWLNFPDLNSLMTYGQSDRSGFGLAALAAVPKKAKTSRADHDSFFERSGTFTPDQANLRIRTRLDSVTYHARWGWTGFRDTLMSAAYEIGGFVGAGYLNYSDAEQALRQAINYAGHGTNNKDELWIRQGLEDGASKPWRIEQPMPVPLEVRAAQREADEADSEGGKKKRGKGPRRLPLIPEEVWARRSWLRAIRDRAHETTAVPDATLGSALAIYASALPHNVKIRTGIKSDLGLSLITGVVSGSGLGKSSGWDLARREFSPSDAPVVKANPTGEGIAEELMGWVKKDVVDPSSGDVKTVKEHVQVTHNALFTFGEGEAVNVGLERNGSMLGPTLRLLFSDEALGTATASVERHRNIPAGSYSMGVVALFQEQTAMKIIEDTATGMAQRVLWFSGHSPSAATTGMRQAHRLVTPNITGLAQEEGPGGEAQYILTVEPSITERLRAEDAAKRDGYSLGDVNRDSQRPVLVAKVAALACLIEGRTLVTEDDWQLADALYSASRAIQDELIEFAEEQDRAKRQEAAVKAGEADSIRKAFNTQVEKVAASMTRKVRDLRRSLSKRELHNSLSKRQRTYIVEALEFAIFDRCWLKEVDEKFELGVAELPEEHK